MIIYFFVSFEGLFCEHGSLTLPTFQVTSLVVKIGNTSRPSRHRDPRTVTKGKRNSGRLLFLSKKLNDSDTIKRLVFFSLFHVPADRLVVRMLSQRSPNRLVDRIVVGSKPGPGTIHFFHIFFIRYLRFLLLFRI